MSPKIKQLFDIAKKDLTFNNEFDIYDKTFKKPNVFTDEATKHLYVAMYWGWMCGKGIQPPFQV